MGSHIETVSPNCSLNLVADEEGLILPGLLDT